jgi:phenylacetate-CoA ligase
MIWNEERECASVSQVKDLVSQRLHDIVDYVYNHCDFYRQKLEFHGVKPQHIKTLNDIEKLPFTTKADLRDAHPFGLFSQPSNQMREFHLSSGTTGKPTISAYTQKDLRIWYEVMARSLFCAGVKPADIIQNAYNYGLFTGGIGVHYGALEIGASVIPVSSGQMRRQLKVMELFKPRVITTTPSGLFYLAEEAKRMEVDPRSSSWQIGILGAEPWTEQTRQTIEEKWNIKAMDIYGLSEIIGPGVAQECECCEGMHVFWDIFYPEVVSSATGKTLGEGATGELVLTTLNKEGMPLLRYHTRDIVSITYKKCRCGRTSPRISRIKGRTDDMIVVGGINIFPSQIEDILLEVEGVKPQFQLVIEAEVAVGDELNLIVEMASDFFSDQISLLRNLESEIKSRVDSELGLPVKVKLVEPTTFQECCGKVKRVIDKRIR